MMNNYLVGIARAVLNSLSLASVGAVWWICPGAAQAQPHGLSERQVNTTLQMPQSPPVYGYALSNLQSNLGMLIMVATPAGETNRLFAVDRAGRILVVTNL